MKNYYNKKKYFGKWLKIKNKRKIIKDLINRKKNAIENDFIKQSKNLNDLLIYKTMQYFFGRLKKIILDVHVFDMLDNSYINNYKKIFMNRITLIPKISKGISMIDKLLKELHKKKAINKIRNKIRTYNLNEKLKNILYDKLKRKFMYKIQQPYNDDSSQKEINLIKKGKKLNRILEKLLKKNVFRKIKNHHHLYKDIDKFKVDITNLLKKKFLDKFKEKIENANGLNKIQKIMDNKRCYIK